MQLDFESQWFVLAVIAMLVVGLPLIVSRVSLPAQLQFAEVSPDQLTPGQAQYFEGTDSTLRALGYQPFTTFRAVNLQSPNLCRAYASSSDAARILVTLITAPRGKSAHNYAEILSKYRDGTVLTTKNSGVSTVFDRMPGQVVQAHPGVEDLVQLKRRHDTKAATLVARGPLYLDQKTFFSDFNDYHRRFCNYQQSKKLLRYNERAGTYRATAWTGLRGIRNFLNPLADNFTPLRFATGLLFGAVLPLLVLYRPAPLLDWLRPRIGLDVALVFAALSGVAFTLGGVIVGYLFRQKSFIWAFLLGYLPTKLLGPVASRALFYSLWMALLADYVSRWRMRRERLV